jgi:aldehyde dehydrogenase (NAD+)
LVQRKVKAQLIEEMKKVIHLFYGTEPQFDEKYSKIINEKHYKRLVDLLSNQEIIWGGGHDSPALKIEPTLVDHVTWENKLMQEEIFGPILPILEFENIEEVPSMVNKNPKPLALYLFTMSKMVEDLILKGISFGGGSINDVVMHLVNSHLPFGGVGESGMGTYHGKYSYEAFSHQKSILKKSNRLDIPLRYPTHKNLRLAKLFLR